MCLARKDIHVKMISCKEKRKKERRLRGQAYSFIVELGL